jgi:hypothetical protein
VSGSLRAKPKSFDSNAMKSVTARRCGSSGLSGYLAMMIEAAYLTTELGAFIVCQIAWWSQEEIRVVFFLSISTRKKNTPKKQYFF